MALDDIELITRPGPSWRPVRGELGIRAFGVGSYVAKEAGQDVIEAHTESAGGRGHEELYLVMRGTARFTVGGERFDAPVGTLVFVRDPDVHRHAVAIEPMTEVLALGGEQVFQPSGSELIWRVRALLPERASDAQSLVDAGLAETPDSPGAWYAQSLVAVADGRVDEARRWLAGAVDREPLLMDAARCEELLAPLVGEQPPR